MAFSPFLNIKIKGNGTRIKSDLSEFTRIEPMPEKMFKICVNPLDPRHPRSIEVQVCPRISVSPW
jgi:hypothetical protein